MQNLNEEVFYSNLPINHHQTLEVCQAVPCYVELQSLLALSQTIQCLLPF